MNGPISLASAAIEVHISQYIFIVSILMWSIPVTVPAFFLQGTWFRTLYNWPFSGWVIFIVPWDWKHLMGFCNQSHYLRKAHVLIISLSLLTHVLIISLSMQGNALIISLSLLGTWLIISLSIYDNALIISLSLWGTCLDNLTFYVRQRFIISLSYVHALRILLSLWGTCLDNLTISIRHMPW